MRGPHCRLHPTSFKHVDPNFQNLGLSQYTTNMAELVSHAIATDSEPDTSPDTQETQQLQIQQQQTTIEALQHEVERLRAEMSARQFSQFCIMNVVR